MKVNAMILRDLFMEDYSGDDYKIIHEDPWISSCKHQYQLLIFKHKEKTYRFKMTRSGSPFTDYHYGWEDWYDDEEIECPEVHQVARTITVWEAVLVK